MTFLSSVKKALGFPDEYEYESEATEDNEQKATENNATSASGLESNTPDESSESQELDIQQLSGDIFDAVIELFNATQPEFVKECLSVESQRAYITGHINESVRKRIETEAKAARARGELQWRQERQRMSADIDKIKTEYNSLKQQREEFQSAQLSAARQKRALNDRIHDLESQVSNLEAEKEQFQLENRSMLNKLRVAGVRSNGNPDAEAEIQRLAEENVSHKEQLESMRNKLENAAAENKALNDKIAQLEQEASTINEEDSEAIAQIEEQIKQFESVKAKKDSRIKELNDANENLKTEVTQLQKSLEEANGTVKTLRQTIEANLVTHASAIAEMQAEIDRLKATETKIETQKRQKQVKENTAKNHESKKQATAEHKPTPTKKGKEVKISAIDELMESTDWFVAPDPIPLKKDPEVEEAFGYKEPVKKTSRDDDKQLSLW